MSGVPSLEAIDRTLSLSRCLGIAAEAGWSLAPALLAPLALSALLYGTGAARLWRRAGPGRDVLAGQAGLFALGWLAMATALVSPLHQASRVIFTAHMIEHELVMVVAAPLLVLARPGAALLWALPRRLRQAAPAVLNAAVTQSLWRRLRQPAGATLLHGAAIWIWHVPALFALALTEEGVHWLQHLSFVLSALLFWWVALGAARTGSGPAIAMLFATSLHTGLLGVLLVISRRLWVPAQTLDAASWGLTPLEDQQLAGLIMWIPGGLVYAVAALVLAGRWIADRPGRARSLPDQAGWRRPDGSGSATWSKSAAS